MLLFYMLKICFIYWFSERSIFKGMKESLDYRNVLGDIYKEIRDDVARLLLVKKKQVNLKVSISLK